MNKFINILIGISLCLIFLASVRMHSIYPIGFGPVWYIGGFTMLALAFYAFFINKNAHTITYLAPICYVIWALWGIFRGQFEITSAFVLNQYFHGILYVLVPMCIFLFAYPDTTIRSLQILNIFIALYSFLSFRWNFNMEAYCFAFPLFYMFYLCFLTKIPWKWTIITLIAVFMVLAARTNGSAIAKILMSLLVLVVFLLPKILQKIACHIAHWAIYIIPIIFLYLGITGQYNIFKNVYIGGTHEKVVVSSHSVESQKQSIHADTRTFIYEEMLTSMFVNDYFVEGRTPARGYFSPHFSADEWNIPGKIHGERFQSEVAHLNTLQWLGLVGLLLVTFVYLQGTTLALYRSNNKYVKLLSLEVAFQWLWSWVENGNRFEILDVTIYILLAICYSPYFRQMSDLEFEMWFKSIFRWPGDEWHDYNKYQVMKTWLIEKLQARKV